MTAHTATPWHIGVRTAHSKRDIYGQQGELIALADGVHNSLATAQANAALIVSAVNNTAGHGINPEAVPDILKALRDLLFHVEEYMDFGKQGGQEAVLQKAARAALLKARKV